MTIKNNASNISNYQFSSADNLLFDANIWLYIYGPQGNPHDIKSQVYSRALADALNARCSIFVDLLVLSEFINTFARLEHVSLRSHGKANPVFKDFRQSPGFKPIAVNIAYSVRQILNYSHRIDDDFMTIDIWALLNEFEQGDSDFNDQVITTLCQSRGLSLVTHDADFRDRGLTVITANNRLLV